MAGVFFTVMGVLFLLDQFEVFDLDLTLVLPVLLIVLGLVVLLGGGRRREEPSAEAAPGEDHRSQTAGPGPDRRDGRT